MTEKDFLLAYVDYVIGNMHLDTKKIRDVHIKLINQFIEEHRKEYYEVKFVKKLKPLEIEDDRKILDMDGGEGPKTIHTLYDGKTVSFTKCWEDNEGYKHHINGCNYQCPIAFSLEEMRKIYNDNA